MICVVCNEAEAIYLFIDSGSPPRCGYCLGRPYEGGEIMFSKKEESVKELRDVIEELRELLFNESNNDDDAGILLVAKRHLTSDLHQKKIARIEEIVKN